MKDFWSGISVFGEIVLVSVLIMYGICAIAATGYPITGNLYAFNDVQGVHGSFFLGSGSVNSEMYYYYLTDQEGGVTMKQAPARDTVIYETDGKPKYEITSKWCGKRYYFYIPEGSIEYGFEVDLE